MQGDNNNPDDDEDGIDLNNKIKDLEKNLEEWLQLRQETVCQLRDNAKEMPGTTCTFQVKAIPVNFLITICNHEIARND